MKARIKPMTPGVPHAARMRAYAAVAVVMLGLFGVAWRAWALQVGDGAHYRELAERQHALTIDIPAPRGEVRDAHGRPLAASAETESVWANPRDIRDVTATADRLAKLIGGEPAALEAKLAGDRRFVWLARRVSPDLARAVREAHMAGIEVTHEPRRWYPARAVGGTVIGRADIDGNGVEGIELSMNAVLTGTRGAARAVRDARGRRMYADGMAPPAPGATVELTIDRSLQAIADEALAQAVRTHKAKNGVVVVLDVATGKVLAMAANPTYDPNGEHPDGARNRAVTDVYEAGSVMKMFSVSAALDSGAVTPDTEFDVQMGAMQIGRHTVRDVHYDKYLTVAGIIKRSSNVGAVKIAQRFGRERLYAALLQFGFGAKTGIELPGEQAGTLRPGARWRDIELATISFGYGLTVTPLQIAAATAAIGNDGILNSPRIVERVIDADGNVLHQATRESHRVISAQTAAQMRKMLASTFEGGKNAGTAHEIVVPGFRCGGKTGTAHKYDPALRKYAEDRYLSSFAGLAPIDKPRLAIVVLVDEPSGGDYFGGKVAGPVFATVASESLRYLGVPGETLVCPPSPPGVLPPAVIAPRTCVVQPKARSPEPMRRPPLAFSEDNPARP